MSELEHARAASELRARRYEEEKVSAGRHVFNVLGIIAILVVAGYFAVWLFSGTGSADGTGDGGAAPPAAPASQPRPLAFSVKIGTDDVAIPALQAESFRFTVRSIPFMAARLTGDFEAVGGSNDIRVMLLDQDGYTNFSNHNAFRGYYDSGRVTVDHPNVALSPGDYYLTFSNEYSLVTPKAVVNHLEVSYSPL